MIHCKHLYLRGLLLLLVATVISACGGAATPEPTDAPAAAQPTSAEAENTADASPPTPMPTEEPADPRLLVWVADASAPGEQRASDAGQVAYMDTDGATETVLALPAGAVTVAACGPNAESPDGSNFVMMDTRFSGGVETATLRLIEGVETATKTLAQGISPIACFGSAPLTWSPDSARFAYIEWPDNASSMDSPYGRLHLLDASGEEQDVYENVTAFDLTNDGAGFVRFFVDGDGFATEVAFATWDGSVDQEVASFVADAEENCYFNSASIEQVRDGFMAIIGYRCRRGANQNTQWRLYVIDTDDRSVQLEQTDTADGRYFVFSDTNAIFASPSADAVFFTLPDGVTSQTASISATSVDDINPTLVVDRFALMSSVSDLPYDANNVTARTSPDGRWLALVVNDGNNLAALNVFDLTDPTLPPIVVGAGDAGDTIGDMVFSRSEPRLYFVAGGDEGANNSLFTLDLTTGSETRMRRGRYGQFVISPDGNTLAIMNWEEVDPDQPRYLTLETIDVATTTPTVIFEGGEVVDGEVTNQRFAYPLSWRQP